MSAFAGAPTDLDARAMESIARAALPHWNLDGARLALLKYRENGVFKVTTEDANYALRVHRPGYHSNEALASELHWVDSLAAAGMAVPRVVPTAGGQRFVTADVPALPVPVQIDLFEWIHGRQFGSVESGVAAESVSEIYHTLGQVAADLHNCSEGWKPPPDFVRHAWDEHGLAGEQPFWGRFWELAALTGGQRRLLSAARDSVYRELAALPKQSAAYGMIHADFSPENLLLDGRQVRLIDFDDAGFGWYLFELVTSLYFIRGEPYFDEAQRALIRGYRTRRPLDDSRLELLPLFFLARSFTYVGWVHTRPDTDTARELTPMLVEASCELAEAWLDRS